MPAGAFFHNILFPPDFCEDAGRLILCTARNQNNVHPALMRKVQQVI